MTITSRQQSYLNSLLDAARDAGKAHQAVAEFNRVTGGDEGNIGSAKGSGTGLRKRLARISVAEASELIDALRAL